MNIAEQATQLKADFDEVKQAGYIKGEEAGRTAGYNYGWEQGLQQGVADGKQAEYDRFWDAVQDNGNRTNYSGAFYGDSWTNETFKPKYDIKIVGSTNANSMFREAKIVGSLKDIMNSLGITIDTSQCTAFSYTFYGNSGITEIPTIDMSKSIAAASVFANNKALETIGLIVGEKLVFNNIVSNCTSLENITITGVIAQSGFDVRSSTKLTKASIESIINALSTTTSGLSITLSQTAVNNAFETTEGAADGSTSDEWTALIATKPNWTINLA